MPISHSGYTLGHKFYVMIMSLKKCGSSNRMDEIYDNLLDHHIGSKDELPNSFQSDTERNEDDILLDHHIGSKDEIPDSFASNTEINEDDSILDHHIGSKDKLPESFPSNTEAMSIRIS